MDGSHNDVRTGPIAFELRVVHLLHSRVLHDLAGPVGAVTNGLELAREASLDADAMQLVNDSARDMAERLRFYRVAFGLAPGAIKTLRETRDLLTPCVIGPRNKVIWPEADHATAWPYGDTALKLLLNMIALAVESLPRGGAIEVFIEQQGSSVGLIVTAGGQNVRLEAPTLSAIAGTAAVEQLTPRTVHGYYTARLAEAAGGRLSLDYPQENLLAIRATVA
jgi:histidine phosphotransferase ChpT